ncbi:MAG: hypothetical protein ABI723_19330 [Bacteroidia bacterium]
MKKTLTLFVIASIVLISVGCQKEDLPVTPSAAGSSCPSYKPSKGSNIRLADVTANKKMQNVVACKACHANKEAAVQ